MGKRLTQEEFIKRAKEKHGNKYLYDNVNYVGIFDKVEIICKEHGSFLQVASAHINNGSGCPKCTKYGIKTLSEHITKAKEVHNYKYNYLLTNFKNCREKVMIICPQHGIFTQTFDNHLRGHGCPSCNFEDNSIAKRLSKKGKHILYYIKIVKNENIYFKIGVTSRTIKERFNNEIKQGSKIIPLLIKEYSSGKEAYREELEVLNKYRINLINNIKVFRTGNTEIFNCDVLGLDNGIN